MTNQDESMFRFKMNQNAFWQECNELNTTIINNKVGKVQQNLIRTESKPTKNWYVRQREVKKKKIIKRK